MQPEELEALSSRMSSISSTALEMRHIQTLNQNELSNINSIYESSSRAAFQIQVLINLNFYIHQETIDLWNNLIVSAELVLSNPSITASIVYSLEIADLMITRYNNSDSDEFLSHNTSETDSIHSDISSEYAGSLTFSSA
jgi:hypothetical protein